MLSVHAKYKPLLATRAQGEYKWLYDWNCFMQNKLCYTGQIISKEERSNWSTIGLLIIEKKQERVDGGGMIFS